MILIEILKMILLRLYEKCENNVQTDLEIFKIIFPLNILKL